MIESVNMYKKKYFYSSTEVNGEIYIKSTIYLATELQIWKETFNKINYIYTRTIYKERCIRCILLNKPVLSEKL